ncbi:uncharacterized protein LOC112556729 [Pomacea canaliculata]|uniref:uncharacterized protein LOC112556729 n=1 Tax=Pomacea canaliculata TaxID=400727 RepID=UPI000D7303DE|nr:uncharacterized protein LOC112556729 [Pomacea canaliculata]XP_025081786.1 uncharacterized protein LOC112556729 [Pomacea canaliculata]XP_025081787.1 uncharacterized protein LOC112556729 [Pomacea canaliculata]XP_025081788.1 uncharacterized protein LOC112556729 [Pomacea canaliculata]
MENNPALRIKLPTEIIEDPSPIFSGTKRDDYYKNLIDKLHRRIENSDVKTPKWLTSLETENFANLKTLGERMNIEEDLGMTNIQEYVNNVLSTLWKQPFNPVPLDEKHPLEDAVHNGDLTFLDACIWRRSKEDKVEALHLACYFGRAAIVQKLLAAGVNVQETWNGQIPLHMASVNGHAEIVSNLLAQGAQVDTRDTVGQTALYIACYKCHYEVVKLLIDKGADVNTSNNMRVSPLHAACMVEGFSMVRTFLKGKADMNGGDFQGATPLRVASPHEIRRLVSLLIDNNADINAADMTGHTPLHYACFFGNKVGVEILIQKEANLNARSITGHTPLSLACMHTVSIMSQLETDTSAVNRSPYSNPLFSNCTDISILLAKKSDVNAQDMEGTTPLHLASFGGHRDLVEALIKHKAKVEIKNTLGQTPLHLGCMQPNKSIVDILLAQGASVNAQDESLRTPLMYASQSGSINIVKRLIEYNACVNASSNEGLAPLHYACINGHKDIADILILHQAKMDVLSVYGITILHYACHHGNKELIHMLLGLGQNVNAKDVDGRTPLHTSSSRGNVDAVRILLQHGADVNCQDNYGTASLHLASHNGFPEVVKLLVEYKADVNAKTREKETSLHFACSNNHDEVAEILLTGGAEVDAKDINGWTPLHIASFQGYMDVVNVLMRHLASVNEKTLLNVSALHLACIYGHLNIVNSLLSHGAEVNATDPRDSFTPLHFATLSGQAQIIKSLIDNKAELNRVDSKGFSSLCYACNRGQKEVVDILLSHGANVNIKTKVGDMTPLLLACQMDFPDIVRRLLQEGANLEAEDAEGRTALHAASNGSSVDLVKLLVTRGARIDHRDKSGWTPLHFACQRGDQNVVDLLLEKSSNVDVTTSDDVTPLHIASSHGHAGAVEALIRKGANLAFKDKTELTALHFAAYYGKKNVVEVLVKEKVSLDATDYKGYTPLHLSCREGYSDIVEMLIRNKANFSLQTSRGFTPLHLASIHGACDIAEILLENFAETEAKDVNKNTPLHLASFNGHKEVVDLLTEWESDINATNSQGYTALHAGCFIGHYEIVDCLLNKNATADLTAKTGKTPLHFACYLGNKQIVMRLFMANANVNAKDINGMTPMHMVCFTGDMEILELLMQRGSIIDTKAKNGYTPLLLACVGRYADIVKRLCESNARSDFADARGVTPLHIASSLGFYEIVDILLKKSKNEITTRDAFGVTPLHCACFNGHSEVVKLLLNNGAEVDERDFQGWTPLHTVCQTDHVNVITVLLQNGARADFTTPEGHTALDIAVWHRNEKVIHLLQKVDSQKKSASKGKTVDKDDRDFHVGHLQPQSASGRKQMKDTPTQDTKSTLKEDAIVKEKTLKENVLDIENYASTKHRYKQHSYESKISDEAGLTSYLEQPPHDRDKGHNHRTKETAEEENSETKKDASSGASLQATCPISHPPIFSPRWQVAKSFTSDGGTLQKLNSDIVLHVPESCVHLGQWIDVKSAVCADAAHVRHVLRTKLQYKKEEWLASPVAEYSSSHSFSLLKGPFRIELPHCLPPDPDPDLIHVYCVLRHSDGHLSLNRVRPERTDIRRKDSTEIGSKVKREADHIGPAVSAADDASPDLSPLCCDDSSSLSTGSLLSDSDRKDSSNTKVSDFEKSRLKLSKDRPPTSDNGQKSAKDCQEVDDDVQWDQSATFRLLPDGKVSITTDHFSAYFCAYCGTRQPPPQLNARAYGSHTERRDGRRAAHVKVLVWDDRLKIADFRQTLGIQHEDDCLGEEILYLADTLQLQDSNLRMSFEILKDCEEWQHKSKNNGDHISAIRESFPLEKYHVMWCSECEEERVKVFGDLRPIKKTWHLENKLNSTPGSYLECLVELEQVPNSNADDRNDNIPFPVVKMVLDMALPQNETENIYDQLKLMNIGQLEVLASQRNMISDQDMERLRNRWKNDDAYKDQLLCRVCESPKLLQATLSALSKQKVFPASRQSRPSDSLETSVSSDGVGATEVIDSIENMSTQGSECSDS